MKKILKKVLPERFLLWFHRIIALTATFYYDFPSRKMVVIGVTGTKGKTSVANFIWSCLSAGGYKTGIISTANIRIGDRELLNRYHMTMPGRFEIQKTMAQMLAAGCEYCVIETTSEGIKQYRDAGIDYDIAVFTNLTPEHLGSHSGSFLKYKETKARMFKSLSLKRKYIEGKKIEKVIVANADSEHSEYFLSFDADKKISFSAKNKSDFTASKIEESRSGVSFRLGEEQYKIRILGKFNVYNALPAIVISKHLGIPQSKILKGFDDLKVIPGRMERVDEGQNFTVIVDYAHEKESISRLLETANSMKKNGKIIILLGAEGGGRDKGKRAIMGELSAKMADFVVVSNVDPYDDDPVQILEDIAISAEKNSKVRDQDLFVIEDRRAGIKKALSLAAKDDIVLITGKGAEQSMIVGGKKIAWDDRTVVREELKKL